MDLFTVKNQLLQGKSIYDLPLRVTFYARVSTDEDEQLHSLNAQIQYYTDFIKKSVSWSFVEGYIDEGISGTTVNKRESFLKMIDDARLGKFDFVITKEISRFSRNTLDSIKYTQELLRYGVGVLFQSDNINTLLPDSELRLTIMSSIAQDEVRKLSERVKFGFKRSIEKGVVLGNNRITGYNKENGKLVINEKEAEIVRKIFDLYANENLGLRRTGQILNELGMYTDLGKPFAMSTIKRIISNPKYKGYYCGGKSHKIDYRSADRKQVDEENWVMYEDNENVPPIVSKELWQKANNILAKRSATQKSDVPTSYTNKYKYSGKILCMEHNVNYHRSLYRYESGDKEVWQCKEYTMKGKQGCTSPTIYTTELDEIMRSVINELIESKADIIHDLLKIYSQNNSHTDIEKDIATFKVEINSINKRKDKLLDLSIANKISDDEFETRNNSLNEEIINIKKKISQLEIDKNKSQNIYDSILTLKDLIAKELEQDGILDNNVIDNIVDRIEVYKTDDKRKVKLNVVLKMFSDSVDFEIERARGKTSVCNRLYT